MDEKKRIVIELNEEQTWFVLKSIALGAEHFSSPRNRGIPFPYFTADRVAKEVAAAIEPTALHTFNWSEGNRNFLTKCRYQIKKVVVTFYEENPKQKPEGY
jgi:hypothetical protein